MNDSEIRQLKMRIDFLEDTARKLSSANFKKSIWLFILSNLIFWIIIGHVSLRSGLNKVEVKLSSQHFKICYQKNNKQIMQKISMS